VIGRQMPARPIGATGLRPRAGRLDRGRRIDGASGWRAQVVAHRYGPRDVAVRRALALADVVAISAALAVALLLASYYPQEFLWGLTSLPVWIVVLKAYGLYDRDIKRISHGTVDDLPWIFHAVLVGSILLFGYYRLTPPGGISLTSAVVFAFAAFLATSSLRALALRLAVSLLGPERVLLIGDRRQIATLGRKLEAHPEYGATPVGIISADSASARISGLPLLGQPEGLDLAAVVRVHAVERVVLAYQDFDESTLLDLLHRSRELGVKVNVLPQPFDALGPSVEVDDVEGITVLGVNPPVLPRSSRFLKRAMDLVGSTVLLLITAPLLALIGFSIKLDSRGEVFFRQERIGRGGRRFLLVKFRTMAADAEERREALFAHSKDPGWLLLDHDPRVTRIGRVLRLSSLDELPQLWNVLKGEMSLVGPRPIIESEDRQLEGWRRSRIDLTPGVTGLWQVLGRTSIPFEEMVKLDYLYVTNWSLWTDIRLIMRTLPAVLLRRGAN
jgi:exopolysaccharide biosynthesis polyprenyl glycosylphosphotransferase